MYFCTKANECRQAKLTSLVLYAFAQQLSPEYTVLLDVGTIPGKDAITRLIRSMDRDVNMAGCAVKLRQAAPDTLIESAEL